MYSLIAARQASLQRSSRLLVSTWAGLSLLAGCGTHNLPADLVVHQASCATVKLEHDSAAYHLLEALGKRDLEGLRRALSQPLAEGFRYSNQLTPLHLAAYSGQPQMVGLLLEQGAAVDAEDCYGNTALHYAAFSLSPETAEVLLNRGASATVSNGKQDTPLHFAAAIPPQLAFAAQGQPSRSLLIRYFPHSELIQLPHKNLNEIEAAKGRMLALLAARGGQVSALNAEGRSPLFYAAMAKDPAGIRTLMAQGADPHPLDNMGRNLLHELAKGPLPVQVLLAQNTRPSEADLDALPVAYAPLQSLIGELIQAGLDPKLSDRTGSQPLHYAARLGQEQLIEVLLQAGVEADTRVGPTDLGPQNPLISEPAPGKFKIDGREFANLIPKGKTPLHLAAELGDLASVRLLVDAGAELDSRDSEAETSRPDLGNTALGLAARAGAQPVVEFLLDRGAQADLGETPALHSAIRSGNSELVRRLLDRGLDVNAGPLAANSPLILAIQAEDLRLLDWLLMAGARVQGPVNPALPWAARKASRAMIERLMAAGADINARDGEGRSALSYALANDESELAAWLLAHGARTPPDAYQASELFDTGLSSEKRQAERFKALKPVLDQTESLDLLNGNGASLLMFWIEQNMSDFSAYALSRGANPNQRDVYGMTALHLAAGKGDLAGVKALLEKGAEAGLVNLDGKLALHLALENGHAEVVRYLLARAPQAAPGDGDYAAWHRAIVAKRTDLARFLLEHGYNPNYRGREGRSALHYAVEANDLALVEACLVQGASLELGTLPAGDKPLHLAVGLEDSNMARALLAAGARVDSVNYQRYPHEDFGGNTPLHEAARAGKLDLVRLLADRGADFSARNLSGETVLHVAAKAGQPMVLAEALARSKDLEGLDDSQHGLLYHAAVARQAETVRWLLPRVSQSQRELVRAELLPDVYLRLNETIRSLLEEASVGKAVSP